PPTLGASRFASRHPRPCSADRTRSARERGETRPPPKRARSRSSPEQGPASAAPSGREVGPEHAELERRRVERLRAHRLVVLVRREDFVPLTAEPEDLEQARERVDEP